MAAVAIIKASSSHLGNGESDVARAASGDRSAFERLYREHVNRVFSLCARMVADRDARRGADAGRLRSCVGKAAPLSWRELVLDLAAPAHGQPRAQRAKERRTATDAGSRRATTRWVEWTRCQASLACRSRPATCSISRKRSNDCRRRAPRVRAARRGRLQARRDRRHARRDVRSHQSAAPSRAAPVAGGTESMTIPTISCEQFVEQLADYLERTSTSDPRRRSTRTLRAAPSAARCSPICASCASNAAALPPRVPERDLWAGIAARIETPVVGFRQPVVSTAGRAAVIGERNECGASGPVSPRRDWSRSRRPSRIS